MENDIKKSNLLDKEIKSFSFVQKTRNNARNKLEIRAEDVIARILKFVPDNISEDKAIAMVKQLKEALTKNNEILFENLNKIEKELLEAIKATGIFETKQIQVLEKVIELAKLSLTFEEYEIMEEMVTLNKSLLIK